MKIAHIGPPGYGSATWSTCYNMALAQYLETDKDYKTAIQLRHEAGAFIMIDNGEAEGERLPFERVLIQALDIRADEIILPDSMRDREETVRLVETNCTQVPPFMRAIVPHGRSAEEWQHCYSDLHKVLEAKYRTICIPKYTESFENGREGILSWLHNVAKATQHYSVHMLGVWGHPAKEIVIGNKYRVRGLDTGAAVAWAQWGADIDEERDERFSLMWEPLSEDTQDQDEQEARLLAMRNAAQLTKWSNIY